MATTSKTEVTLTFTLSDGSQKQVTFDVQNGTDATVNADTVIATTKNPTATLGEAVDAALAALPETSLADYIKAGADGNAVTELHITLPDGSTADFSVADGIAFTTPATGAIVINPNAKAPATQTSAGKTGEIRLAGQFLYYCNVGGADGKASWRCMRFGLDNDAWLPDPNHIVVVNPTAAAPAKITSAGTTGEIRRGGSWMYWCYRGGTEGNAHWVRLPYDGTWTS